MQPIDKHVFSPPAGWHRTPARPGGYKGVWGRDSEVITLDWFDVPKNVSFLDFNPSKEPYLREFHLGSSKMIHICGGHDARIQAYQAKSLFGEQSFIEVVTKWGDTLYVARYQRWPFKPEIQAATKSLTTLCAGEDSVAKSDQKVGAKTKEKK